MNQTTTYTVTGMTCGHCVSSVTEEVQEIPEELELKLPPSKWVDHKRLVSCRTVLPKFHAPAFQNIYFHL